MSIETFEHHKDSLEKIKSSAKLIYCFIRKRESSKSKFKTFLFKNQHVNFYHDGDLSISRLRKSSLDFAEIPVILHRSMLMKISC